MKNLSLLLVLGLSVLLACSGKKEESTVTNQTWKEMDDFHMAMAEAFHPYKDSANLEPAKSTASLLSASAARWAASAPDKEIAAPIKDKLKQLETEAAAFDAMVKSGKNDTALGESLTSLHDLFHGIEKEWYGGGHEHH
jgi:hypothetical protein